MSPAAEDVTSVDPLVVPAGASVSITACRNGPLLVRGDFEVLTGAGQPVPRRRRTVALCRCGFSAIKPYCDGSHKAAAFRTEDGE